MCIIHTLSIYIYTHTYIYAKAGSTEYEIESETNYIKVQDHYIVHLFLNMVAH